MRSPFRSETMTESGNANSQGFRDPYHRSLLVLLNLKNLHQPVGEISPTTAVHRSGSRNMVHFPQRSPSFGWP